MHQMNLTERFGQIRKEVKCRLPKKAAHYLLFYRQHGTWPNFRQPTTYDEKVHWMIVHRYDESYGKYADKFLVREYVKACGLESLLIPLYGVYDDAKQIDYDALPNEFFLVATHGSGERFYEFCPDKNLLNREMIEKKMNDSLACQYWKRALEYHYGGIRPRILCLKLLKRPGREATDRL